MTRTRVWFVLALLLAAGACAKKDGGDANTGGQDTTAVGARPGMMAVPGDSLAAGPWHWIATVTPVERIVAPDPSRYTVEFVSDSTVTARLDCNRGSGGYTRDGKSIRIGPLASTRMMCPPGSMDSKFGQQLDAARNWFMQGDTLMLDLLADSGTMSFVR